MPKTTRKGLINDYRIELGIARKWQSDGRTDVSAETAGPVAAGRERVPIEEYVSHWERGLTALEAGEPVEDWEY